MTIATIAIAIIVAGALAWIAISGVWLMRHGCMWQDLRCPLCGKPIHYPEDEVRLIGAQLAHTSCVIRKEAERA
jgi:hypothetical protein